MEGFRVALPVWLRFEICLRWMEEEMKVEVWRYD